VSESVNSRQRLWYIRHEGVVSGPFPSGGVRRFVLLGRVSLQDEVSSDREIWQGVAQVPEVVPPEVRKALAGGLLNEILPARLGEDERTGLDRRKRSEAAPTRKQLQERKGERRQEEPELVQRHRLAKTELRRQLQQRKRSWPAVLVFGLLVLAAVGYGIYLGNGPVITDPDCMARPAPGVNWRNCRLPGLQAEFSDLRGAVLSNAQLPDARFSGSNFTAADLRYAVLNGADLSHGDFHNARMMGAGLRNANLAYADFTGADLRFAVLAGAHLSGAVLTGARLDNALWVDGRKCLPGSLGECRKADE